MDNVTRSKKIGNLEIEILDSGQALYLLVYRGKKLVEETKYTYANADRAVNQFGFLVNKYSLANFFNGVTV